MRATVSNWRESGMAVSCALFALVGWAGLMGVLERGAPADQAPVLTCALIVGVATAATWLEAEARAFMNGR